MAEKAKQSQCCNCESLLRELDVALGAANS